MTYTGTLREDTEYEMPESGLVTIGYRGRYTLGTKNCPGDEMLNVAASDAICLPVYAYVHGGATLRTTPFTCPWDSAQSGIAWISKKDAIREWGGKILTKAVRQKAEAYIKGFVEEFDHALRGDVWGYIIEKDGEHVDDCWGIYGEDYAEEEMQRALAGYKEGAAA